LYETKDHAVLKVLTITTALQNKPKIGISQPQRKGKKKKQVQMGTEKSIQAL
jgi:hypothetical protein